VHFQRVFAFVDNTLAFVDNIKLRDQQANTVCALNEYEKNMKHLKSNGIRTNGLSVSQLISVVSEINDKISSSTLETVLFKHFIGNLSINKIFKELFIRPICF
jgi:hypothetical protein